jgi:hypothetical protein
MSELNNSMIFGALPETNPDPRNYNISQFVPGEDEIIDKEFILKFPKTQIIIDQGSVGACVGHAFIMAKQILEYNHTNKWIDFDPFALYGTRFIGEYMGVGMYPVQGAKVLYKEGAFFRRDFNKRQEMPMLYDTVKEWKKSNPEKVKKAKDYTITGYSYVYNTNGIKKALKNTMPVAICYPIYDSFYKTGNDGIVPVPNTSKEKINGYHEMLIVGWTANRYWIVINSWGVNYGLKGMYLIPFDNKWDSAVAVSDTITPSTYKAKEIKFKVGTDTFYVDSIEKKFDVVPYIKDSRTYVPVRFVTESLGASVEWNGETREVTIRSEEAVIVMTIGSKTVLVNNTKYNLDVAPEIVNDRTMLPIRCIAEYLNCEVNWEASTSSVIINAL